MLSLHIIGMLGTSGRSDDQGCIQDSGLGWEGRRKLSFLKSWEGNAIWECIDVQRLGGGVL